MLFRRLATVLSVLFVLLAGIGLLWQLRVPLSGADGLLAFLVAIAVPFGVLAWGYTSAESRSTEYW